MVCRREFLAMLRSSLTFNRDIVNFRLALQDAQPVESFMPAVSPGTLAQNVINEYYKGEEEFLFAVAEVM